MANKKKVMAAASAIFIALILSVNWAYVWPEKGFTSDFLKSLGINTYSVIYEKDCSSFVDRCMSAVFTTQQRPRIAGLNRADELDAPYLIQQANTLAKGDIQFSEYHIYRGDFFSSQGHCARGCGVVFMEKINSHYYFLSISKN